MKRNTQGKVEIYPGSYIPSHTETDICAQTSASVSGETDCAVSIKELNLYYQVTMIIPTAKKEDINISVNDHIATITACRDKQEENRLADSSQKNLEVFFTKTVKLPADADADFVHAVFEKDMLQIFIAKSKRSCTVQHHTVAVY